MNLTINHLSLIMPLLRPEDAERYLPLLNSAIAHESGQLRICQGAYFYA
jgi:hypothetical protein